MKTECRPRDRAPLDSYLSKIAGHPPPTAAEEREMFARHSATAPGSDECREARDAIVLANLRLVVWIAKRLNRKYGWPVDDMIGPGNVGLIRAVACFRPGDGNRFSTYATKAITVTILRQRDMEEGTPVHVPNGILTARNRHCRTGELPADAGRRRCLEESRWTERRVRFDVGPGRANAETDLAAAIDEEHEGDGRCIALLTAALATLTPRWREVIERRYGLGGREPETLEEIARADGVSKQAVHNTSIKAIKSIRAHVARGEGNA